MTELDYDKLNSEIRYSLISVFTATPGALEDRDAAGSELQAYLDGLEAKGVTVRGVYNVAGFRADADFMIWTHSENLEALQAGYTDLRRTTAVGRASTPFWSVMSLHRPAEFNKQHVPAFVAGEDPGDFICVYPFVRSYDWYLLPEAERRELITGHGMLGRQFPDVRANTASAFALGDYEFILAFESEKLDRIVDLMRTLRAAEARRHVRVEIPFFTGPRVTPAALTTILP